MIEARDFLDPCLDRGYTFWSGVPCSFLTPFINSVIQHEKLDYIGGASEGEVVGIAAGAHLAGRKTVAICQNSGLGNMVNPLTSLNAPFKIPTLLITTHRGDPNLKDEPQHQLMGQITGALLETMGIPWEYFPQKKEEIPAALDRACKYMDEKQSPYAFVMKKGTVNKCSLDEQTSKEPYGERTVLGSFSRTLTERVMRLDALKVIRNTFTEQEAFVATTGKIGREFYALGHRENQIYSVGAMGCASSMALGLHQGSLGTRKVVVLDGDGAALMKMGALATIGHQSPKNFVHVLLDNEAHESTGAQATCSSTVDFAQIALACNYKKAYRTDSLTELESFLKEAQNEQGPVLIHMKVAVGSDPSLGRPTLTPEQVKNQFMNWYKKNG